MAYTIEMFKLLGTDVDKEHIKFWENNLNSLPEPHTPNISRLTEEEFANTAYSVTPIKGTRIYVDNALRGIVNGYNCDKFIKACFLSEYFQNTPYTDFRRYIFRWDKEAKHVGKHNTFVRSDFLKVSIGAQNAFHRNKGVVTIRANGSKEGLSEKYNSLMSSALPYLAQLQQGPSKHGVLLDILDSEPIKDYSLTPGIETRYFDLHHILVINGISADKTVEPTFLLGRTEFQKLKHVDIIEILKCILLTPGMHKEIHSHFGANSGFTDWQRLYNNAQIKMLPYYLLNEENYNETLDWLDNECVNFNRHLCVSYTEFIKSIS